MPRPFYIVDVFAEERYTGNQLAVIQDAAGLSDAEMQRIAQEMNYSETTFILADEAGENGYPVRIFTPETELPFAGHPSLGTAYIIRQEIQQEADAEQVTLDLKAGPIPVTFHEGDILWMQQRVPEFGGTFSKPAMASVLGLEPGEIHPDFPVQSVSTGLPFVIVPLTSLHAVKRIKLDMERFGMLCESTDDPLEAIYLLVFAPETYQADNDLNVRVFVPEMGIPEDPATGSANGCLAGYLSHHQFFGDDVVDCRVEQGYEINRQSLLLLKAHKTDADIAVSVGGRVIMVARGELV